MNSASCCNREEGRFPHNDAADKLIYRVLRSVADSWKRPPQSCSQARSEITIRFEERLSMQLGEHDRRGISQPALLTHCSPTE